MAIEITDFPDVQHRSAELGVNAPDHLSLLPRNFESATSYGELIQESESATVLTLWRQNGLPVSKFENEGERIPYIQENAFEWIGPTIFIGAAILSSDPNAVGVALGVIANYLTAIFKGNTDSEKVKFGVVVENKNTKKCKKINYEGNVEGVEKLTDLIRELSDE